MMLVMIKAWISTICILGVAMSIVVALRRYHDSTALTVLLTVLSIVFSNMVGERLFRFFNHQASERDAKRDDV